MAAQPPQTLKAEHSQIAFLISQGKTDAQIAAIIGKSRTWVGQVRKSPLVQALADDYGRQLAEAGLSEAKAKARAYALPAIEKLVWLIDHATSETTQLNAINSLLDRIGLVRTTHQETDGELRIRLIGSEEESRMKLALAETTLDGDYSVLPIKTMEVILEETEAAEAPLEPE